MSKRYLTILVLSGDSTGKPKKIKLPVSVKAARNLSVILVLGLLFIVYDYGHMRLASKELARLKKENTTQKIELQGLSSNITDLESRMAKLKLFDKKLRIIANLEEPAGESKEVMGMGGASPDDDTFPTLGARRKALINQMHSDLALLEGESFLQEQSFTELQEFLLKQSSLLASIPSIHPTRGWITSTFGKRKDPFTGRRQNHKGMDISNRIGTDIVAPADGIVTKIKRFASLGKMVEISHGYGIKTRYGHLSKSYVKVGQKIKRGQKIASMGNTGRSTGPHLHYEVIVNGVHVNPSKYVLN